MRKPLRLRGHEPGQARWGLTAAVLSAAAWLIVFWGLSQLDAPIEMFTRSVHIIWLEQAGNFFALIGSGQFLAICLVVLFLFGWRRGSARVRRIALDAGVALAFVSVVVQVVKHLLGRPRPRLIHGMGGTWGPSLQSGFDSFPSGHTAASFAVATVMAYYYPRGRWFWFGTAGLVAASRVVRGSHFPTDIAGGAWIGLLGGLLAVHQFRAWKVHALAFWRTAMAWFMGFFALLWTMLHARPGGVAVAVMFGAGLLLFILWTLMRLPLGMRQRGPSRGSPSGLLTAPECAAFGLALTTGLWLVAGLAALFWLFACVCSPQSRPVQAEADPQSLRNQDARALPREAALAIGLGSGVIAIQFVQGLVPLL